MTQKSILITGCSSGIGFNAATQLRALGWQVFAACRKEEDCERLRQMGFESPRMDYTDHDSLHKGLAEVLESTGGTLDALFNNGAYAIPAAVEDLPTDALRALFEANVFGWHELTRAVIPVMRAQGHGRIVQCSSVLGLVGLPMRGSYVATKFAIEGLTETLRIEMKGTNIQIAMIEPGPITTKFRQNCIAPFERWIDWENSPRAQQYKQALIPRLYHPKGPDRFELPASAVVEKLIRALEDRKAKPRYFVTFPTYLMSGLRRILPGRMMDWILSRV